jgi:hypothetical protein
MALEDDEEERNGETLTVMSFELHRREFRVIPNQEEEASAEFFGYDGALVLSKRRRVVGLRSWAGSDNAGRSDYWARK